MSKFKVVDGSNIELLSKRNIESRQLEKEINKKSNYTNKDYVVFAYHFMRLNNFIKAQKYLNKLDDDYFISGIYKDLFKAMLVWSLVGTNPKFKDKKYGRFYEYFIIVKKSLDLFDQLIFDSKKQFLIFKKDFLDFDVHITTL